MDLAPAVTRAPRPRGAYAVGNRQRLRRAARGRSDITIMERAQQHLANATTHIASSDGGPGEAGGAQAGPERLQTLQLAEIFYSVQGEGTWTGTPAVFVRLAGCNLACNFCDTDYALKFVASVDDVVERVRAEGGDCPMVIVT